MSKEKDPNRKTTIPLKGIPQIVEWLLASCTRDELSFMASLAGNRKNFILLANILTRLTDYNMHEVFYEKNLRDPLDIAIFRAAKRGEVAGLKAFQRACQLANQKLEEEKEK